MAYKKTEIDDSVFSTLDGGSIKASTSKESLKVASEVKKVSINSLEGVINKKFGERTLFIPTAVAEVAAIPTLSYTLNHASGIGGLAIGFLHEIYGDTGAGKTALSLGVVANAQKMNMKCLYIDAENRFDMNRAKHFGVNTDTLYLSNCAIIEQVFDLVVDCIKNGDFQLVVLDSLATLMSEKEFDSDMDANDMGKKAQLIGKGIKKIIGTISEIKAQHKEWTVPTIVLTNQIRSNVGMTFGNPEMVPGGKAPKFFSSQRIRLQAKNYIDENGKDYSMGNMNESPVPLVGVRVFHKHTKNTFGPPQKAGAYNLMWDDSTFDWKDEVIQLGLIEGIIDHPSSSAYVFDGVKIIGIDKTIQYFKDTPAAVEKLIEKLGLKLIDRVQPSIKDLSKKSVIDLNDEEDPTL